jgi:hypothetical protein
MGWRFYRRVKILPGVSINFSKSGTSVSVGTRGAHVTVGPRGTRETVGSPGTGISYRGSSSIHGNLYGRVLCAMFSLAGSSHSPWSCVRNCPINPGPPLDPNWPMHAAFYPCIPPC